MDETTTAFNRLLESPEPGLSYFARLATFPEQNPNPVIEIGETGEITYLNPAATARFPDLTTSGLAHPLLEGLSLLIEDLRHELHEPIEREVQFDGMSFAQRICPVPGPPSVMIRVYAHELTQIRNAERANRELARRVVLAQEEERRRVSHELHDEAGQALAALRISLELLRGDGHNLENILAGLDDAIYLVDETRNQIRQIAHGLRPPVLDALDLDATLEGFCQDFGSRTGLAINYQGTDMGEPADAIRVALYRSLQEALANVALHAGADTVTVSLRRRNGTVHLEIRDDGIGFDLPQPDGPIGGRGIAWMAERIELLAGTMEILSQPGFGTTLRIALPWDSE